MRQGLFQYVKPALQCHEHAGSPLPWAQLRALADIQESSHVTFYLEIYGTVSHCPHAAKSKSELEPAALSSGAEGREPEVMGMPAPGKVGVGSGLVLGDARVCG